MLKFNLGSEEISIHEVERRYTAMIKGMLFRSLADMLPYKATNQ
jgi:hypothetical protein